MIDFRSDASTPPTQEMRQAMIDSFVGDDVYEDDPTTIELENYAANLLGKEAALFVPSGCFGNQVCIMASTNRGDEILVSDKSHIIQYEKAANSFLSAVLTRNLKGDSKGLMDLENVEENIRKGYDVHFPTCKLLCLENPTTNGNVASIEYMQNMYNLAKKYNLTVHLDGARIFNAASYLNIEAKEIAKYCDSVMFCLSKGLCAPIGSIICGSKDFIFKARYCRKLMGGGMRQTGVLAGPGLVSLKKHIPLLKEDQQMAVLFAQESNKRFSDFIEPIDIQNIQINMVYFQIKEQVNFETNDLVEFVKKDANILILPQFYNKIYRIVTHYYTKEKEIRTLLNSFEKFFQQLP